MLTKYIITLLKHRTLNVSVKKEKKPPTISYFCPFFAEFRPRLISPVNEVLQKDGLLHVAYETDIYLYGHFSIDVSDNRIILQSSIRYLKDTKRFSSS